MSRSKLIEALKEAAKRFKEKHPEVTSVILFGSIARGDYGYKSDADILIILEKSDKSKYFERISDYILDFDAPIPVEIFPFTKDEIKNKEKNAIIKIALNEGIKLV